MVRITKKVIILWIGLTLLANGFLVLSSLNNEGETHYVGWNLSELTEIIDEGREISFVIPGNNDKLMNISVFFSTYARNNTGNLLMTVSSHGDTIFRQRVALNEISDNSFFDFGNINIQMKKNEEYTVTFSAENGNESGVSAWRDESGNLVAWYVTEKCLSVDDFLKVNAFFVPLNLIACLMLKALRRK